MLQLALQEEGTCAPKQGLVLCVGARPLHHHRCNGVPLAGSWWGWYVDIS